MIPFYSDTSPSILDEKVPFHVDGKQSPETAHPRNRPAEGSAYGTLALGEIAAAEVRATRPRSRVAIPAFSISNRQACLLRPHSRCRRTFTRLASERFFVGELIVLYVCASKLGEQQNESREQHHSGSNPECDG